MAVPPLHSASHVLCSSEAQFTVSFWFLLPCIGFWRLKCWGTSCPSFSTSSSVRTESETYLNFCCYSRTALRSCEWKTSFASLFLSEWPRSLFCSMVPTRGPLQRCIRILLPVLVNHPDGCKLAEEVSIKYGIDIFVRLVRSVCFGCI